MMSPELQTLSQRIEELEGTLIALRARLAMSDTRDNAIWIKTRSGHSRIAIADIFKICAERDYVRIFALQGNFLHADTIGRIEASLPAPSFLRIHRSTIVRVDAVTHVRSSSSGTLYLTLFDGEDVRVGRKYLHSARSIVRQGEGGRVPRLECSGFSGNAH